MRPKCSALKHTTVDDIFLGAWAIFQSFTIKVLIDEYGVTETVLLSDLLASVFNKYCHLIDLELHPKQN